MQPVVEQRVAQGRIEHAPAGDLEAVRARIVQSREGGEPFPAQGVGGGAAQRGAVRDGLGGVRPVDGQTREDHVTQMVARKRGVRIGRIVDGDEIVRIEILAQRRARQGQQGAPQHAAAERTGFAHAAQALRSGAAQQFEQHGFGLVVAMVGEHEPFARSQRGGEGGVARPARGGLQTLAMPDHVHAHDRAGDAEPVAELRAMPRPAGAVRLQAVIHVQRTQAAHARLGHGGQRVQQCGGVGAAAEGHAQGTGRLLAQRVPEPFGKPQGAHDPGKVRSMCERPCKPYGGAGPAQAIPDRRRSCASDDSAVPADRGWGSRRVRRAGAAGRP